MSQFSQAPNRRQILQEAFKLGFHRVGIAAVTPEPDGAEVEAVNHLQRWLEQGYQADMAWMANPKRQDIRQVLPEVRSVIAVALNYYTDSPEAQDEDGAKISRYAWGRDYHKVLHRRLKQLCRWLEDSDPDIRAKYYADTGPVQDKVWAQRAGIGWIAKNGNLITRDYGSWVFLGEVVTNLPLEGDRPHTDHCGTCTRCIEACPTAAIVRPSVVDANRCLAYHTIENRSDRLPDEIAKNLNGWVAGCDICQEVCPWNQRFAQTTDVEAFQPYPQNQNPTLSELAHLSDEDWDQRFRASALRRIKPAMWRRNSQQAKTSPD
ncbi:tRNA epoxyqueuosine(34) reductase QueG [Geitlerinema sp. P-1104]|uniref:tRNA epoxyqueuosine(34) reductase QueG n=1 Tax=Geitlerinema sp. P-1104 TaxID=2546230 RepID=UPI001476CE7D|nr:tRNA epoxyqueuosine(34) reductase QueG [Geitlerinema sp. P-1104]NMG58869.1 tRNA epoxyqueuosine(34) reductase QueG [Geitlerinema sp. P-1104]